MNDTILIQKFISCLWNENSWEMELFVTGNKFVKNNIKKLLIEEVMGETGIKDYELIGQCLEEYIDSIKDKVDVSDSIFIPQTI